MNVKLDVDEFVADYCQGIKDRDMIARHNLTPKEFVAVVRKLMNQGLITKDEYVNRNRKIEELEARQEREFLKSLYHCPVCSHIHPAPFTICPACGVDIEKLNEEPESGSEDLTYLDAESPTPQNGMDEESDFESTPEDVPSPKALVHPVSTPTQIHEIDRFKAIEERASAHVPLMSLPSELLGKVGSELEDIVWFGPEKYADSQYRVVDITNSGYKAAMFKAEDDTGLGAEIAVKVFRRNYIPSDLFDDFFAELVSYQAGTDDDNILPLLGTATLAGERALLYPHMPKTLEDLLAAHPDGLPFDLIDYFIPQILNAVGYCHIHRGKDDVARRSPHMNIKPSKFLMDEYNSIVKLEDTGLWIAVTHNRGHKGYLWEEPGADLSALAPETFVLETKSLNGFYVDIYALGAILYRMATGKRLFTAEDVKGYSFAHLRTYAAPPRVIRWQVPAWLDTMVLKCVEKDPTKRWRSATQMELSVGREFHG